jgi:hypothetical protein
MRSNNIKVSPQEFVVVMLVLLMVGFVKCAAETPSDCMIWVPSFMKIGTGIQAILRLLLSLALQPSWALGSDFQFRNHFTGLLGRVISSSQGLYLNTWQHKHRINTYTYQTYMPCVGFEPTIPASEEAKTVYALDRLATVKSGDSSDFSLVALWHRLVSQVGANSPFPFAQTEFLSWYSIWVTTTQPIFEHTHIYPGHLSRIFLRNVDPLSQRSVHLPLIFINVLAFA